MWRWRAQEVKNEEPTEKELLQQKIKELEKLLIESKVWALQDVKRTLKFNVLEKLTKPLVCIQMENAAVIYFDNVKPFELFTMNGETRQNAALQLLDREYDCAFRGAIGNHAYFCTTRGKVIKFFRTLNIDGGIKLKQINEMNTSEISLFKNQPLYLIERSKKWSVYQYHDNYSHIEGEQFDISEIDLLSKYERHYHRGVIYLFRETTTAKIERVNEKVVKVKGPLLDGVSFYTPPHSDFIYILNAEQRVIIVLNTIDLAVSQVYYEPPADANNHTIVGIHEGILTMAFDGVWGRNLSTAKMH